MKINFIPFLAVKLDGSALSFWFWQPLLLLYWHAGPASTLARHHRPGQLDRSQVLIIARILKVRDDLFFCGLLFVYFASPVGSVLDLYRSVGPYDKIVHFFSGILLASLGAMIMSMLLKRAVHTIKNRRNICLQAAFAFFLFFYQFWHLEIFEFTADRLSGGDIVRYSGSNRYHRRQHGRTDLFSHLHDPDRCRKSPHRR